MNTKQKPLLPTLKEKKRYIKYRVYSKNTLNGNFGSLIISELNGILGLLEASKAGLIPIKYYQDSKTGVFKVNNKFVRKARASLMLISQIGNEKIMVKPEITGGILKKIEMR